MKSCFLLAFVLLPSALHAAEPTIEIRTPQSPPTWALLERELIKVNSAACKEFYQRYFDDRGWLLCVERWGGDDGPDDAIENLQDWPLLYAMGGSDDVLKMLKTAWEGHLRQYTIARTKDVPFARDGMYFKEFPVMFDWMHNGEGLCVFNLMGLCDPYDDAFRRRTQRFAGFYMNEDPGAPNYDSRHKIIKSMFNGSRGPLLRPATALDWAGDPIEVENRFKPAHGETSYKQMLEHFETYTDIVGDQPQNLLATTLGLNAFMLDRQDKYKDWVMEYVNAWRDRMETNGNVIPSKIGLDGKIGGPAGKWYGSVYGWGFTMKMPDGKIVHRNNVPRAIHGFMNAYMLSGDDRYLEAWRKQTDVINSKRKMVEGVEQTPTMYGDDGWYAYVPGLWRFGGREIYHLSQKPSDRTRVNDPWFDFLDGKNPGFVENSLRRDLAHVRQRVEAMRKDTTTPDTRLADDPMKFNPASVDSMTQLVMGGLPTGKAGAALFCRLRYFDAVKRRPGLPDDTAAMNTDSATVGLINLNQLEERTVVVQAGGYAEHRFSSAKIDGKDVPIYGTALTVKLAPGAGGVITFTMKRYANPPSFAWPIK